MMRFRRNSAVFLLTAIAFAMVLLVTPAAALTGDTAIARFGGCLASQRSGQLLLMLDESSSLQDSDPAANRVKAARYLADQLADYADRTGIRIDVAVAGFASSYDQALGWTKLDSTTLPKIVSTIEAFGAKNNGTETDYWSALEGARAEFANAPKLTGPPRCQALAWFTDGKLDFGQSDATKVFAPGVKLNSPGGIKEAIAAAQQGICRDRGLADQIRSSGIVMFAIGLAPKPEQGPDFDLLKAIATGQPAGSVTTCGAIKSPVPGDFYLAQNIEDLLFAFDKFGTPDQAPIEINTGSCARVICEEGKHRFVLDRSVRSVNVLAAADRPGLVPYLIAPDGASLDMTGPSKTAQLTGVAVDWRSQSDKSISFRMSGSQVPSWQGVWAFVYVDPTGEAAAKTHSSIHIAGDLFPAWPDAGRAGLRSKEKTSLTFAVVDGKKQQIDPTTLLGQASFSAVFIDSGGVEHRIAAALPKEQIAAPQVVDLTSFATGAGTLRLSLDVTTAAATDSSGATVPGTKLTPQRVDLPVIIAPPAGYPTVTGAIDFGTLEGPGTFSADVRVTGPGCVWLPADGKNDVTGMPDGAGAVTFKSSVNSKDSCLKLAEGQEKSLSVEIAVPNAVNGSVNGSLEFMLAPDAGDLAPISQSVAYSASLQKPLDPFKKWTALLVGLILGPGLPLGLFYLAKWWNSRIPARGLRVQQIPARVTGEHVFRGNGPFALAGGELNSLVPGLDKRATQLDLGAGVELRAKMGLGLSAVGYVVAKAVGRAGAAGPAAAMIGNTPDAKLPLAVHNHWFVLHDPAGPAGDATVVLLASVDADDQVVQNMVNDVIASLPKVLAELRARVNAQSDKGPLPDPSDPFSAVQQPSDNPFGGPVRPRGAGSAGPSSSPWSDPFGSENSSAPIPDNSNPFGPQSGPKTSSFGEPRGPGSSPFGDSSGPGSSPFG